MAGGCFKFFGGVGVILAILSIIAAILVQLWFKGFLKAEITAFVSVTGVDSAQYKAFRNATEEIDLFEDYYVFNVTNPEDVANHGAAVKTEQFGPFTMRIHKYKPEANISWGTDGTLSFMAQTSYEFLSGPADLPADFYSTHKLTTYRLGLLGAMKKLTYGLTTPNLAGDAFDMIALAVMGECTTSMNITSPFIQLTPKELLLGYTDPFMTCLKQNDFVSMLKQPVNSTDSTALSGVYSGGDYSDTVKAPPKNKENEMTMYLGMTELPYWGSKYANMINGTNGHQLLPGEAKSNHLVYVWIDTFLRSAVFQGYSSYTYKGVDTVRYGLYLPSFQCGKTNPDNVALHITTTGVQPLPPSVDHPVSFGKPYYLDADTKNIKVKWVGKSKDIVTNKGLPQHDLDTMLYYEPHTGILFKAHKRLMGSASLGPGAKLPLTEDPLFAFAANWTDTYAPIFWADEHFELSDHRVNEFKAYLDLPLWISKFGAVALLVCAIVFIALSVVCCCCARRADKKERDEFTGYSDPAPEPQDK